jgi:glutathione synthase
MTLKLAFQMEPLEETDPSDNSSIFLMDAAQRRGHQLFHYEPSRLSLVASKVIANVREVKIDLDNTPHYEYGEPGRMELGAFDAVLFRQDPPLDMNYITNTNMLEMAADDTLLINNPYWIRNKTDKLYPFDFPEYMPATLVSADVEEMERFIDEHKAIVIKPLYGFGGHGIKRHAAGDNLVETLSNYDEGEILLLQPFLPEVFTQNKRISFLDGEIVGSTQISPAEGEFRIYRDSVNNDFELSTRDKEICDAVSAKFRERGLFFVGVDIIGDYLIEINLGSVGIRSLRGEGERHSDAFVNTFWQAIENKLKA